jgi:hypothetical protein
MKLKLKEMRKYFVRRLAAISDLHLMSKYSLFPPSFTNKEGNVFTPNPGQVELWKSYQSFVNVCDEWEVDTVLIAGDVIHGQNPIERGMGLISTSLNDQLELGEKVLTPILKGRDSHWVSGSGYHNSAKGMSIEEELCKRMRTVNDVGKSNWYGPIANLRIKPFNKITNLTHGGGRAAYYRETLAAREMVYGKAAEVNGKLSKIDMYIHGHFHWYNYMHQANVHHLQLPGWTAYEPIALFTPAYTRMQPDIGGVLIFFDETGRILVWHFLYGLPHISDSVVEV